jgi:hypothetical protein
MTICTINSPAFPILLCCPPCSFTHPKYFFFEGEKLIMRVHAGGYKSPNSHFPRTEMRETGAQGEEVGWSIMDRKWHIIQTTGSVDKFTSLSVHPEVVILQIHTDEIGNACSVPLIVKVAAGRGSNLAQGHHRVLVNFQGKRLGTLTMRYELGSSYTLKVSAGYGMINVYWRYGGQGSLEEPVFSVPATCAQEGYYKTGEGWWPVVRGPLGR